MKKYQIVLLAFLLASCTNGKPILDRSDEFDFPMLREGDEKYHGHMLIKDKEIGKMYDFYREYDHFIILEKGSHISIFPKLDKESLLDYKESEILYRSPENSDESLIGIYSHFAFVSGGTSPGFQQLKICDLNTKTVIFDGEWYPNLKSFLFLDEYVVVVYKSNDDRVSIDNMFGYKGSMHAFSFDLRTKKIRDLGFDVYGYGQ